ncbi:MAG: tannase/feruloyl esterase family alpha/beta hydrolase [Hyphomonadaceae bacterium]
MIGANLRTLLAAGLATLAAACTGAQEPPIVDAQGEGHTSSISALTACQTLSGKTLENAKLTTTLVEATKSTPIYCKVSGTIAPKLNFEIRLPDAWNGKLYYGGGGGYNGVIPDLAVAPLNQGYAQVASDSGHQGDGMSPDFIQNDPLAAELFGSLSVPTVMTVAMKVLTEAYGAPPVRSYFEGCSTGGREALMAVQRNPELFDGVIARAPAFNWVGLMGAFNTVARAVASPGGDFNAAKAAMLARHVRSACDGLDGVEDGIVSNPSACTTKVLNLTSLRCAGGADAGDMCLSDAQLAVVKTWTSDLTFNGVSSSYLSKGFNLSGNEDDPEGFGLWVSGNGDVTQGGAFIMQDGTTKYYLAHDPKMDTLKYAPWDKDPNALDAMAALNDATGPDIQPFIERGGKVIVWQGGSDAALSVSSTTDYMSKVRDVVGATNSAKATRTYVAPGVNHCGGGAGPDQADLLAALDEWVTEGRAPGNLIAQKLDTEGKTIRALPLCQYPQYPRYKGPANDSSAVTLAANYVCTEPQSQ